MPHTRIIKPPTKSGLGTAVVQHQATPWPWKDWATLFKMPLSMNVDGLDVLISAVPLTSDAFAPFGEVVENPRPDLHPSQHPAVADPGGAKAQTQPPLPFDAVSANQGSAIKYQHVTRMVDLYGQAPSKVAGQAVMNMFSCAARKLQRQRQGSGPASGSEGYFNVQILERHPYTTQTFSPLAKDSDARYLVVVAPSLPPSDADAALPVPSSGVPHGRSRTLPGRGLPDLRRLKAFVATGSQAVTYGAGTWHAPMVALGREGSVVDFVVVQFANGVGVEDCQEVVFTSSMSKGSPRISVSIAQKTRESRL